MRVYHLRRKVSEPLRIAVKNHIPAPPEDSITEWIELYYQFWKNQEADRQITGSSGNRGVGDAPHNQGQNGNIQTGDPMDLDRMQLSRVTVTPAEWQYPRDHGLSKRSKRQFDTADRDLQSGSRSGPQYSQDSYRGNYNSGHDLRPRQDSFQASQYPNYPLPNYSRNNEIKPRGNYSNYNGNRGGFNCGRTRLRLQEIEESNYNPRSTYSSQPPCGTHLDEFVHERGQVLGEVDADNSYYSHFAASRNGQGNGGPQHQVACGALLYKVVLIQAKSQYHYLEPSIHFTELMFVRKAWAQAKGLSFIPLPHPRPLCLADGCVSELITHRIVGSLSVMNHMEEVNALVTTLGPENELILGFPWLELHNPTIDWQSKSLIFDKEYCAKNCLTPRTSNFKPASVVEIPDEGGITGDMVKQPSDASKLVIIPDPAKHIQNEPKGELSSSKINNNLDVNDIKILNAPRFFQVFKDKDVHVMRIMAEDLLALDSFQGELNVPLLPEIDFQELLRGRGDPTVWKGQFSEPFHDFINSLFSQNIAKLKKITDEDVKKFFQKVDIPPLTKEEIKRKMPQVYHDIADFALPQDAANLSPHRSYDHKIELLPGNQKFPQSRA
ncbi:hypothetical protein K3495_g3746 [Podosphaera aphanis]|nr:hypothetical protein K3495_g3746 [Podosphaera aphanis]